MITAENLTKRYGAKTAVDGISITVRLGQVTGFLGPNGAGRSTAMGMIVGLDRRTSVTVNGRPNAEHRSPLTEVGALLEVKAVHIGRSAVAQLRAVAATHGFGRKRVAEVIEMTDLQSVAGKRVGGSGRQMRAAVYHRFGGPDRVQVEELPRPPVGRSDVLIRVCATTVSAADHRARSRDIPRGLWLLAAFGIGILRPKRPVLGMDVAGIVEAVGADVNSCQPGDEVIALLGARFGGHAEYAVVRQDDPIALKPPNMTLEDAVTLVFGGLTARGFLKQADVAPGATVLVNGAAGAVGTAAVQLAKHAGARVTGVCGGTNRELVVSLGADRVIDYMTEDFAAGATAEYDVIVDCVGNAPFSRVKRLLKPRGALLLVTADLQALLRAPWLSRRTGTVVTASVGKPTAKDLAYLVALAGAGHYRAVRDRTYDLTEIAAAHRYVDTGHKRGNVVVRITSSEHEPTPFIEQKTEQSS